MAKATKAGRKGGLDTTREALALLTSLDEAGDAIDVKSVMARLNCTEDYARRLLEIVLETGFGETYFPVYGEQDELTLADDSTVHGRRLRLTMGETKAVIAALDQLGIEEDDQIYQQLSASLLAPGVDAAELERALLPGAEGETADVLSVCSTAMAQDMGLTFAYQKRDNKPETRHVTPMNLKREDDFWYLRAWDADKHGKRTFRLDRMSDVKAGEKLEDVGTPAADSGSRRVEVTFTDPSYLQLLDWPGLRVTKRSETGVTVTLPYHGGMWLPRHLVACGGTATTTDAEVTDLMHRYAEESLAAL